MLAKSRTLSLVVWVWMLFSVNSVSAQKAQASEVENLLRSEMTKREIPGLQVAVVREGKIVLLGAYGLANVEHSVPVNNSTVFSIHSATKSFTGVAIMQLVESGKLKLDVPVAEYLDALPSAWRAVTIRQLLTHVSGIPNIVDQNTGKMVVDGNQEASWAKVQSMPMEFASGSQFSYNQTNYLLRDSRLSGS